MKTLETQIDRATTQVGIGLEEAALRLLQHDPALRVAVAADEAEAAVDGAIDQRTSLDGLPTQVAAPLDTGIRRIVERDPTGVIAGGLAEAGAYLREVDPAQLKVDVGELLRSTPSRALALGRKATASIRESLGGDLEGRPATDAN